MESVRGHHVKYKIVSSYYRRMTVAIEIVDEFIHNFGVNYCYRLSDIRRHMPNKKRLLSAVCRTRCVVYDLRAKSEVSRDS